MITMYAIRHAPKGKKPSIIRVYTEKQAREWCAKILSFKYIGKVKIKAH